MTDCTFYVGNSQHMDRIADDAVDFIFTGPPYWTHLSYSQEDGQLGNIQDYTLFHEEVAKTWSECHRVLKPGSFMCIQANNLYVHDQGVIKRRIPLVEDFSHRISQQGFEPANVVFWDSYLPLKRTLLPFDWRKSARARNMVTERMQFLLFFIKPGGTDRISAKQKRNMGKYYWEPIWNDKVVPKLLGSGNLFKLANAILHLIPAEDISQLPLMRSFKSKVVHHDERQEDRYPAYGCEAVIEKLLLDFTEPGDLVLDPFAGCGTTLKVASKLNRRCIGYEINQKVVDVVRDQMGNRIEIVLTAQEGGTPGR